MKALKSFLIAVCEALLLLFTLAGTALGSLWGMSLTQLTDPILPLQAYFGPQTLEYIGIGVGAAAGFLGPAAIASVLFLLAEIQKNTRETAAALKFITEGASLPAQPYA